MDQIYPFLVRQLTELFKRLDPNSSDALNRETATQFVMRSQNPSPEITSHMLWMKSLAEKDPLTMSANCPFVSYGGSSYMAVSTTVPPETAIEEALTQKFGGVTFPDQTTLNRTHINLMLNNGLHVLLRASEPIAR